MKDDSRGANKCVIWGGGFPRESAQNTLGRIFEPKVSPRSSRFVFGPLLAPFWNHFGATFGFILEVVKRKTLFYLHGSSFFKSCYVLLGFYAFRGHSSNSSFTCMGALFSRFRLRFQKNEVFVFLSFSTSSKEDGKKEGQKAKSGEKSRAEKRRQKRFE